MRPFTFSLLILHWLKGYAVSLFSEAPLDEWSQETWAFGGLFLEGQLLSGWLLFVQRGIGDNPEQFFVCRVMEEALFLCFYNTASAITAVYFGILWAHVG